MKKGLTLEDKIEILLRSSTFSGLDTDELRALAELTTDRSFAAGEFIFHEGDVAESFYVVAEGKVKVLKNASSGRDFIIGFFGPGEMFGELMEDQNRRYLVDGFPLISVLDNRHLDSKGQPLKGQDGQTIFYHQLKYKAYEDDVPLTHGAEMRVLQAEAALRNKDFTAAQTYLNQARSKWGMAPLTLSTNEAEAWATLRFERYATLFLEGRRLWDMRRWSVEGPPRADPAAAGRDLCFPISENEGRSNPNVAAYSGGCPTCG